MKYHVTLADLVEKKKALFNIYSHKAYEKFIFFPYLGSIFHHGGEIVNVHDA